MGQRQPEPKPQPKPEVQYKSDYDFFRSFPNCALTYRPPQLDKDSYAHATAYAYSLRNCLNQHTIVHSETDILVRTATDSLKATTSRGIPCGTPTVGGDSACVASYFGRTDGNPARKIKESDFERELKNNGPFVASIDMTASLLKHLEEKIDTPYNPQKPIIDKTERHATTVVGTGTTDNGRRYWECEDSNVDSTGKPFKYKIMSDTIVIRGVVQDIKNPIPFRRATEKHFGMAERIASERKWGGELIGNLEDYDYEPTPDGQWRTKQPN